MSETEATIKKVVKEGLEARNLVNYISDSSLDAAVKISAKPPTSPKPHSAPSKPPFGDSAKDVDPRILLKTKRRGALSRPKSRLRSASAGRNPEKDLRARYWTFLFENLHRAVDEIYQTCEMDESIIESKEAIMMLESYSKDFHALIQYININKDYEKTAPINRPTSLAWEVRKSSPGKSFLKNVFIEKLTAGTSQAKRILCFDAPNDTQSISKDEALNVSKELEPTVLNLISIEKITEKETNCLSMEKQDHLNEKEDGITISVVPETVEEFPCNDSLVVKEICCLSDKSSIIVEVESENVNPDTEAMTVVPCGDDSKTGDDPIPNKILVSRENLLESVEKPEEKKADVIKVVVDSETNKQNVENEEITSSLNVINADKESFSEISENKKDVSSQSLSEETSLTSSIEKKKTPLKRKVVIRKSSKVSNEKVLQNSSKSSLTTEERNNLKNKIETPTLNKGTDKASTKIVTRECDTVSIKKVDDSAAVSKNVPTPGIGKSTDKASNKIVTRECDTVSTRKVDDSAAVSKNVTTPLIAKNTDKASNKIVTKECDAVSTKKVDDSAAVSKNVTAPQITKKTINKPATEKSVSTSTNRPVSAKPALVVRKVSPKVDTPEDKKAPRTFSRPSAIQRNISYVSSLSSKNQLEKAASEEKKRPLRTISHAMKMPPKSGSMSSLHKISAAHRWSDKASSVEQITEAMKSNADEDSDGWETVRGRNRCRNSPAKKIPFSSEKNDKVHDIAKLSQSRFGGFPYTTKNSSKVAPSKTTPKKDEKNSNKNNKPAKSENTPDSSKSSTPSDQQIQSGSQKSDSNKLTPKSGLTNEFNLKHAENSLDNVSSKFETKSEDNNLVNNLFIELELSEEVSNRIKSSVFMCNKLIKSASDPCLNRDFNRTTTCGLSKANSMSELSINRKKYAKVKHISRNSVEKHLNLTRRKSKKSSSKPQDANNADDGLNTSLDESDTGLTSDDQDGQTSHDEAYDAHCQELCDTAWKYKILEQQVHKLELSWGEQMDRYDMELRTPGRALEMHEKLSSPFRKKSLMESIRLQEEKQVKAREQRERLLDEKLQKIKEIEKKRIEMKTLLDQRQEKQRILMEQKLQRAEEKRKKQLQMIIKKAHDEEEKVNEIAFINTLEAQNKRHDLISKEKDHEARLHDIQEERQRKQEEKAAKEAAAEERRKLLEAERQARLNEMQEKRKIRDHKVEQLFLVKEKERQELASQKARDREQRLSALNAQQQISIEELQKKIQLKQEESARRHEENMEQIRQKAFELSIRRCSSNNDDAPQPVPYETKKICTLCNVLIGSEVYLLSHLRGKKHQETVKDQYQGNDPSAEELELYNLKHIVDASTDQLDPNIAFDKERQKALKKRCKKLRQRMSNRGQDYESQLEKSADNVNSNVKSKVSKIAADIKKFITTYEKSSNDNNLLSALERCLNELENVLEKKLHQDKVAFRAVGGLAVLVDVFKLVSNLPMEKSVFLHKKIINHLSNTAESIVEKCPENCLYLLYSNKIGCLLDLLIQRLNVLIPNNYNQMIVNTSKSPGLNIQVDVTAGKLMHFLSSILSALAAKHTLLNQNGVDNADPENESKDFQFRIQDVISYTVSIGIVDKLSQYFNSIQGPIGNEGEVANYLLDCVAFLISLTKLYTDCFNPTSNSKSDDSTQLIAAIKVTNMVGSVSLLYVLLLHSGVSSRGETPPPQLPKQIELLVISTLRMLNHMAVMNLQAFQTTLGSEGLSLQLRHITSHLLWYCNHWTSDALLHEVILLVGYFTVLNVDNQSLIQAGQRPTVLQQLCSLPFLYFSDSELTDILFPTLITCCFNNSSNKTILEQEMSSELLSNYIEVKYLNGEECSTKSKKAVPEKRWLFSTRFPKNCWSSAKHYFAVN